MKAWIGNPFISYRVTLNSRKIRDLFEISSLGTNSALSANARIRR